VIYLSAVACTLLGECSRGASGAMTIGSDDPTPGHVSDGLLMDAGIGIKSTR
jgi:hypothetical protein